MLLFLLLIVIKQIVVNNCCAKLRIFVENNKFYVQNVQAIGLLFEKIYRFGKHLSLTLFAKTNIREENKKFPLDLTPNACDITPRYDQYHQEIHFVSR
jgi:hypothetical protein